MGSGYPSDPNTVEWLKKNFNEVFGYENIVRFSWGTTKTQLEKNGVEVRWVDGEPIYSHAWT
jgi:ribonuclease H2 subunit A